jgi:hypothetical protein
VNWDAGLDRPLAVTGKFERALSNMVSTFMSGWTGEVSMRKPVDELMCVRKSALAESLTPDLLACSLKHLNSGVMQKAVGMCLTDATRDM